jgi:hypothetical protein
VATPTYSNWSFYQPVAPKKKKPVLGVDYGRDSFYQPFQPGAIAPPPTAGPAPVAAPGPVGPPSSIRAPGYDPDYASLIAADPLLIAGKGDLDFFSGQLGDARRAAIRRAVIEAGIIPTTGATGDVDEQTLEAARQNQFSGAAELERGRSRATADVGANLAGRGILSSGGLVNGRQRVQEGFERGTSQLTNSLLSAITGYEQDFNAKMADVRGQYNALKEAAAARVAADPRYQPIGETDAVLDPSSGLYMTPDGRWYDAAGNRVGAPSPRAAAPAPTAPPPLQSPTVFPVSRPVENPLPGRSVAV